MGFKSIKIRSELLRLDLGHSISGLTLKSLTHWTSENSTFEPIRGVLFGAWAAAMLVAHKLLLLLAHTGAAKSTLQRCKNNH